MSIPSSNAMHSSSNPDHSPTQDLNALVSTLQETAQALLDFQSRNSSEQDEPELRGFSRGRAGETRSYYFPPGTANMERELLRKYQVDDFRGLLEEAHTMLLGLVKVMQSVPKDVRVKGEVISSLGNQVGNASSLLLRIRNVYDRVMPIQK